MTSKRERKSESDRKKAKRFQMALLPPNPTDEDLQRFVDFLNAELAEQPSEPTESSPKSPKV